MDTENNTRNDAEHISENMISDNEKDNKITDPAKDFFNAIRNNEPQDAEFSEIEEVQNTANEQNLFEAFSDVSSSTDIELYEDSESVEGEPLFQTGEVAKMFNVTRQTIRNTADFFVDILSDERGSNGCKLYTNEDIAIIKKIQELKDMQYSRRDIRDILISQGVSAKGKSLREINIDKDELPITGESQQPSPIIPKNEDFQLAFTDAMKNLQAVMLERMSQSLVDMEANIKQAFLKDINSANDNLGKLINSSIDASKDQLLEVIRLQEEKIKEQHQEIIRLKSTILNINHTTLATDSKLEKIGNLPTKDEIEGFRNDVNEAIKNNTVSEETIKEIKSQLTDSTQNTAKHVDKIAKEQNAVFTRIEEKINILGNEKPKQIDTKVIEENLGKKYDAAASKIIKSNKESLTHIETAIKKILEEKENKIDEALMNEVNEKLKQANNEISQLKKNNTKLESKNKENVLVIKDQAKQIEENEGIVAESEQLSERNKVLARKVEIAQELIKRVTNENDELKNKVQISKTIISKQDQELSRLKVENSAKQIIENGINNTTKNPDDTPAPSPNGQAKQVQNTANENELEKKDENYLDDYYEEKKEEPKKRKGFFFKKG